MEKYSIHVRDMYENLFKTIFRIFLPYDESVFQYLFYHLTKDFLVINESEDNTLYVATFLHKEENLVAFIKHDKVGDELIFSLYKVSEEVRKKLEEMKKKKKRC